MPDWSKKKIKDILFAINHFTWTSIYPTSEYVDYWLNDCLNKELPIKRIGNHTVEIDGKEVWVANYPYAFGNIYRSPNLLPYRRTRKRLYDKLVKSKVMIVGKDNDFI